MVDIVLFKRFVGISEVAYQCSSCVYVIDKNKRCIFKSVTFKRKDVAMNEFFSPALYY